MLPLLFGLVALTGFLLNPFADANTLQDLRAKLAGPEALTSLCIVQFLLTMAALVLGLWMTAEDSRSACGLLLAVVHVLPAPALLIAMLLVEQAILGDTPGARPEAVGRQVGFAVAGLVTLAGLLAMAVPPRWLAGLHGLLATGLLLACMFLPNLQTPLPAPLASMDLASLDLCWKVALGFVGLVLVGWGCGAWARSTSTAPLRSAAGR
jgi:hypothetical protein